MPKIVKFVGLFLKLRSIRLGCFFSCFCIFQHIFHMVCFPKVVQEQRLG